MTDYIVFGVLILVTAFIFIIVWRARKSKKDKFYRCDDAPSGQTWFGAFLDWLHG